MDRIVGIETEYAADVEVNEPGELLADNLGHRSLVMQRCQLLHDTLNGLQLHHPPPVVAELGRDNLPCVRHLTRVDPTGSRTTTAAGQARPPGESCSVVEVNRPSEFGCAGEFCRAGESCPASEVCWVGKVCAPGEV